MVQMLELISTDLSDCRISNSSKYTLLNISSSSLTTLEWVRERERVRVRVRARERERVRERVREREEVNPQVSVCCHTQNILFLTYFSEFW